MPGVVRRSYARRLALLCLVALAVLGGVAAVAVLQADRATADSARAEVRETARTEATALSRRIDALEGQTALLAQASARYDCESPNCGGDPELGEALTAAREAMPASVVAVHYVRSPADPVVLESTADDAVGTTLPADSPPLAGLDGGGTRLSAPWRASAPVAGDADRAAFATVRRVPGESALVVVVVDAARFGEPLGNGAATAVLDGRSGRIALSSRPDRLASTDESLSAAVARAATATATPSGSGNATGTYLARSTENGTVAAGVAPVEGTDWTVVTSTPTDRAFALRGVVRRSLLVVAGGAALLLIGVVAAIGRGTAGELSSLTDAAEAAADGEPPAGDARADEFGDLHAALADAARTVREQREAAEQVREETERSQQVLQRAAREYSEVMEACASGDLTARTDPVEADAAMGTVGRAFNEMVRRLEAATARVEQFAREVAAASQQVTASVQEVKSASEQVAQNSERISQGAAEQNQKLQTVSERIDALSASAEAIGSAANDVSEQVDRTARLGQSGRESARTAIDRIDRVAEESTASVESFERLAAQLEEIEELTGTLAEIAEQTNRLALNANIEASRGGEGDSEGFSAVAEEIRDLAAQAQEATEETEALIADIREQADETAAAVRETNEVAEAGADSVREAVDTLERIADRADQISTGVREIDEATHSQAAAADEVADLVEEVADIGDRTAEEASQVAAATQEQTSALTAVSNSVEDLAERADRLTELLGDYETRPVEELSDGAATGSGDGVGDPASDGNGNGDDGDA